MLEVPKSPGPAPLNALTVGRRLSTQRHERDLNLLSGAAA